LGREKKKVDCMLEVVSKEKNLCRQQLDILMSSEESTQSTREHKQSPITNLKQQKENLAKFHSQPAQRGSSTQAKRRV